MRRWLAWNVWFRLQEFAKGHDTLRILADMEAADRLSASALHDLQRTRLRAFIDACYRDVPFVRRRMDEYNIRPGEIAGPEDLQRLPLLTKQDVRRYRQELRSSGGRRLTSFATGGSTGEPLIFDLGKRRIAARVACRQRVARWWGVSIGDPEVALWGSPIELTRQDWIRSVRDRFLASRLLSAFDMTTERMTQYLDVLEAQGCRQLFGYPSAIYFLCVHAERQHRDLRHIGIRVAFTTGEVLLPYQRDLISRTLSCPVADGYGGRDSGFVAHECPQGGMHVLTDAVVLEVVDDEGRPVAPGQRGQLVVTDLYSEDAPFIRYATGDVGAMSTSVCSCGRALPLLQRIEGRSNDAVIAPDGRAINALALIYALREINGIEQYRVVQQRVDRFAVELVCTPAYERESGEERIRTAWSSLLRAPVHAVFEYRSHIPTDPRGKFRHIVSEVNARDLQERPAAAESANEGAL
jgi:phenylacetate-CoA ligase